MYLIHPQKADLGKSWVEPACPQAQNFPFGESLSAHNYHAVKFSHPGFLSDDQPVMHYNLRGGTSRSLLRREAL
jgi:hypothetical protein